MNPQGLQETFGSGKLKEINRRIADLWKGLGIEKVRRIEKIVIQEWLTTGIKFNSLII